MVQRLVPSVQPKPEAITPPKKKQPKRKRLKDNIEPRFEKTYLNLAGKLNSKFSSFRMSKSIY
jgi:hypothetical protein